MVPPARLQAFPSTLDGSQAPFPRRRSGQKPRSWASSTAWVRTGSGPSGRYL